MTTNLFGHKKLHVRAIDINFRCTRKGIKQRINADDLWAVVLRARGKCEWCNKPITHRYAFDHIVPFRMGSECTNSISNIALSCISCNCRKADKHPVRWVLEVAANGYVSNLGRIILARYPDYEPMEQLKIQWDQKVLTRRQVYMVGDTEFRGYGYVKQSLRVKALTDKLIRHADLNQ